MPGCVDWENKYGWRLNGGMYWGIIAGVMVSDKDLLCGVW